MKVPASNLSVLQGGSPPREEQGEEVQLPETTARPVLRQNSLVTQRQISMVVLWKQARQEVRQHCFID